MVKEFISQEKILSKNFFNCKEISLFNSSIGHLNYFVSEIIILKNSNIKNMNHFSNLKILKCQEKSIIGSYNLIKSNNNRKKGYVKLNKSQISSNFIGGKLVLIFNTIFKNLGFFWSGQDKLS